MTGDLSTTSYALAERICVRSPSAPSCLLAMRAPSTSDLNFAQTMLGCTSFEPAKVAKPQSAPAITFSRPDHLGVAPDALGDEFRMLDQHGRMADHAGNERLARPAA